MVRSTIACGLVLGTALVVAAACTTSPTFIDDGPGAGGASTGSGAAGSGAAGGGGGAPRDGGHGGHSGEAGVAGHAKDAGHAGDAGDAGHDAGPCGQPVDCANPSCADAGYACQPVPLTWSTAVFKPDPTFTCPAGYGMPQPRETAPASGATCTCTCGQAPENPCTQQSVALHLGTNSGCAQQTIQLQDGACTPVVIFNQQFVRVTPPPPAALACPGTAVLPPLASATAGVACAPLDESATGCSLAHVCAPVAAASTRCVQHAGVEPCPLGYPVQYVLYAPASVVDQRTCGACACTSSAATCSAATVAEYQDQACSVQEFQAPANGACEMAMGGGPFQQFYKYSATPNTLACAVTNAGGGPPVAGMVVVHDPVTVCCP